MIRLNELKLPIGASEEDVKSLAAKELNIPVSELKDFRIARMSIDSRNKERIRLTFSAEFTVDGDESSLISDFPPNRASVFEPYEYTPPAVNRTSPLRPVIVGFGPAGMFAALLLSKAGLKPIVLERGERVEDRTETVKRFWKNRALNTDSNVQFGEGGAGTFSDGKLTTGIKDPRVRYVLSTLAEHGAPKEILYSAKPHIGTDLLANVVRDIRETVIKNGGEIRFGCRLTDLIISNGAVFGVRYLENGKAEREIETDCVLLCIGHSARDTFEMLLGKGVKMQKKPFSVGVRIEHPQELINKMQYGREWNNPLLGAADYKLSNHPKHGRGGYTFCMCPGGVVVTASSEEGMLVVNGMSEYARDGENANSAILIGVEPDYFESEHPLSGIEFQRELERKAFLLGGGDYTAPAQLVGDFIKDRPSAKLGAVKPSCTTGVTMSDIRKVLPDNITAPLKDALFSFDRQFKGFLLPDAVLTAVESRSSSPVRILRDDLYQSNIRGLYPCGEGAGYAGGIVSAAVDGLRCAEAVLKDET
ncbi:MAG TPA: hypothetical protein PKO20_05360 [Clostridiales bacterium]|jgi:uncharacterized FAD-dependent dehydrogenase|nr:hypothetical protein [Clostridiales bacterium]HQA05629.1 hypothetical protein [Clostridiales bacterium]HXK83833.1 hypothetical protein [Clostridiales bacterium]